ncbi:hypothetical protein [Enterobacter hormaechei]|uniref:hypothetical protein n=1 Tax=Enterobacter hormaechei TaxID=158836 RepID=UPI003C788794
MQLFYVDRSGSEEPTEILVSNFLSFLAVKRSIRRIRKQNNSISLFGNSDSNQFIEYNKNTFKSILKGFTIVLEVSFAMRSIHSAISTAPMGAIDM